LNNVQCGDTQILNNVHNKVMRMFKPSIHPCPALGIVRQRTAPAGKKIAVDGQPADKTAAPVFR
jgi:hypothetical protein